MFLKRHFTIWPFKAENGMVFKEVIWMHESAQISSHNIRLNMTESFPEPGLF